MKLGDYFNEKARTWDNTAAEKDTIKLEKLAERMSIPEGGAVLDVGTGTGVFLPYLLRKVGATGHIYALDIAEKMLAEARRKNLGDNITFICGDVENLTLPGETCDAVVCYSSFPHFRDKALALREMKRVLKPGGWLYIGHSSSRQHINEIHTKIEVAKHDLLPDAIEMKMLLDAAGFHGVAVSDKAESYLAVGQKIN